MRNPFQVFTKSILLIFTLSFFLCLKGFAQDQSVISLSVEAQAKVDSLKQLIATAKQDTSKVKLLLKLGEQYDYIIPDTALFYYQKALDISENISAKSSIAKCFRYIGNIHHDQGDYDKATEYHLKALEIFEGLGIKRGMLDCYINIGNIYLEQGIYDKALTDYLKALKIAEELGNKRGMAFCYNNIGNVHIERGSYVKALEYFHKSLKIKEELGNKRGMAICYINIGMVHHNQDDYDKAFEYYLKSLKIFEELGDKRGMANCYSAIGALYHDQGSYDQEIQYHFKSLKIAEEQGNKNVMAIIYLNIASLNIALADSTALTENQRLNYLNKAIEYGNKSNELAKEMGAMPEVNDAANTLMKAYKKLGNYKKAIEFADLFISTQDSMFREEKTKAIQEMETKYETEKKQQQIELQESQLVAKDAKIKQQKIFRNALIVGFCAVVLIIIVIAYAYRQKRKDNKMIVEQNEKILEANEELNQLNESISEQKKDIIDSINYAQRIQSAILPPEIYVSELLHENFVFYKPKDIVSGDYYWIKQINHNIILVAGDCTGHGVPGAFMSMLGISYLNAIVQRKEITQANLVLNELRKQIKQALRQTGRKGEADDGMDIALCVYDTKNNMLQYSGANNPLYLIQNNELIEIKADRMPVGYYPNEKLSFTNHEIQLKEGDIFYLFSDGFIDQFGGKKGFKYKAGNFQKILIENHNKPMAIQKGLLEQELKSWMKGYDQTDDILVIGVRV